MGISDLDKVRGCVDSESDRLLQDLCTLLSQPSISAQNTGIDQCADLLAGMLQEAGIEAEVLPTGGHPVVFGEIQAGEDLPTLVIYGHYDVQPVDPLDQWRTPPFQPTIVGDHLYARGATDDKGNLMATIKAVEALLQVRGHLPLNLKFLFEGEEEIGSPSLEGFLKANRERFAGSEAVVCCDVGVHESGRPALYLGNKGVIIGEIRLAGPKQEVHSSQAPLLPNPAWDLVRLLSDIKPDGETVAIPGFYDRAAEPTPQERALVEDIPFSSTEYMSAYGVNRLLAQGSSSEALIELLYRPTFNIQGMFSGYTGPGSKNVVPSEATAKFDIRIVDNMTVEDTLSKIRAFLAERGLDSAFEFRVGVETCKLSHENRIVQMAMEAARQVYGMKPVVWPLVEGFGPFQLFPSILGIPTFTIGLGAPLSTCNSHGPNENIAIHQYLTGIKMMVAFYSIFGETY